MAFELTEWQKAAARAYGGGDFAYLADQTFASREAFEEEIENLGDTLFVFVMVELDKNEDCDTADEAVRRLNTSLSELQTVISAIEAMPEPTAPAS